jgi:2-polyprenyl-3-methyl-5-hydroxy-6-metoxy-1,4-benzoquinol methylase
MPAEESAQWSVQDDWDVHWEAFAAAAEHNPAQLYRRRLAAKLLERTSTPVRLLDIGSGQGDFLAEAADRWPRAKLVGLEASERGNQMAQVKLRSATFATVDLSRDCPPARGLANWATHATCLEVLEHVDEPVLLLGHARAYLAPGAQLIVTVPGGRMSAFDEQIGHRRHYSPELLRTMLAEAGLCTQMTFGAGFPFFNLYRRIIIARGKRLAGDVSSGGGGPSGAARLGMAAFRPLLSASLTRSPWGTQIVGVATEPE